MNTKEEMKNNFIGTAKNNGIGAIIREQRKRKKFTQEYVAERVGLSDKHFSRIEGGKYIPNLINFFNILEVLELNLEDFSDKKLHQRKAERDIMHLIEDASEENLELALNILKLILKK